jgi:hypothetical protein
MPYEPDNCPHGTDRNNFNCMNCQAEDEKANAPATVEQARDRSAAMVNDLKPPRGWHHFVLLIRDDGSECAMAYHPEMDPRTLESACVQIAGTLRAQGELDVAGEPDGD